jgi:hypothetical protein
VSKGIGKVGSKSPETIGAFFIALRKEASNAFHTNTYWNSESGL